MSCEKKVAYWMWNYFELEEWVLVYVATLSFLLRWFSPGSWKVMKHISWSRSMKKKRSMNHEAEAQMARCKRGERGDSFEREEICVLSEFILASWLYHSESLHSSPISFSIQQYSFLPPYTSIPEQHKSHFNPLSSTRVLSSSTVYYLFLKWRKVYLNFLG